MLDVAGRNDDALAAGEAGDPAAVEKPLDLLVDPADRLDLAALIDRAGHRERLLDRRLGQSRQQRKQLGGGGAVAVDPAIGLLEHQAGVQRQRPVPAEAAAEKSGEDQHALRMQRAAELDLALDIDDLAAAEPHLRRDAGRRAERKVAEA